MPCVKKISNISGRMPHLQSLFWIRSFPLFGTETAKSPIHGTSTLWETLKFFKEYALLLYPHKRRFVRINISILVTLHK